MFIVVVVLFVLTNFLLTSSSSVNPINIYQPDFIFNETREILNVTRPKHFVYTWPNGSVIRYNLTLPVKGQQVDCLGLGSTIANALEWFFRPSDSHNHVLDVRFFLTSQNKRYRVEALVGPQFGLEWTDFKIERKTVIIVHGFLSHGQESWISEMENAFLLDDVNVIVVDWSGHGNTWNYYKAAVNAKSVGRQIAKFLSHIVNATVAISPHMEDWGPIHMVGHSLGAHICGIAAEEFKKLQTPWKIMRITGLDPAQPCFTNTASSLNSSDAKFVDVIHTNGRMLSKLGLGLPQSIGHVDFYPNGGRDQLGCVGDQTSFFDYLKIPKSSIIQAICSHGRSYIYFTESIIAAAANNGTFWGHIWDKSYRRALRVMNEACDINTCVEMGINAVKYDYRGSFFVVTSSSPPYYDVRPSDVEQLKRLLWTDFSGEREDK